MATPAANPTPPPTAKVVGNAFVDQYYHILHQSPELVYRFYQDTSFLSRPGPNGDLVSVTTMQAINDMILSLDYKHYKAEIKTIDAQDSYKDGVVVLVTGWLTVKDNVKRKFTQSFFLAPQDKGFFVLNDVFRYVDEYDSVEISAIPVNGITENILSAPVTPDPEPSHVPDPPVPDNTKTTTEVAYGNGEVVHEPSDNDEVSDSVVEVDIVEAPVHPAQNEVHPVTEPASAVQEDTPKKSYASIVKVMKGTKVSSPVYVLTNTGKVASGATGKAASGTAEQKSVETAAPAPVPEASAPTSNNGPESSNVPEDVEGHSIYLRSLPLNATVVQVEEEFKRFGPIRPAGVQVRSNKQQGFCFGFVEFESYSSMQSALEASPVTIGTRQVHIEEKRTTTRVGGNGRPRFPPARTGFRNDNFRGRGNFSGGRSFGRNEFGNRGDFSGRRGPPGRNGEGYQRVDHNLGNGRVGRQGGINQTAVSA